MKTTIFLNGLTVAGFAMIFLGLWSLYVVIVERTAEHLEDFLPTAQTMTIGLGLIGIARALDMLLALHGFR